MKQMKITKKLKVAAPELLQASKDALVELEQYGESYPDDKGTQKAIKQLRSAIAKAE